MIVSQNYSTHLFFFITVNHHLHFTRLSSIMEIGSEIGGEDGVTRDPFELMSFTKNPSGEAAEEFLQPLSRV